MQYVQVNIGRNVEGVMMDHVTWDEFRFAVADVLTECADVIAPPEFHFGAGVWDGVKEESCHVSVLATFVDVDTLREQLAFLAREYQQDCVALILGSELVGAAG